MIYAYDEPVVFPTVDLYDSGMMGAYLSAAKDQYDKALADEKEFLEKYGDFLSPIIGDVNHWYNDILSPMYDEVDKIYAAGGDPLRNPIDRATARLLRNRIIRSGELPKLRLSADAAKEYLKNRAALEAAGKYNPAFETMILNNMGLPDFEHWDTAENGIWSRLSPGEFKDLNQYTSHIFDDLKDSFIGRTKDGKWLINGVNEDAMRNALTSHLSGIVGSDLGKWYYEQAKRELTAEGNENPSDADIMKRLQDNIITANAERVHNNITGDPYAIKQTEHAYDMAKARYNNDRADRRAILKGSSSGGGNKSGNKLLFNINDFLFKQGAANIINGTPTGDQFSKNTGSPITYSTFNPLAWSDIIGLAQKDRANLVFGTVAPKLRPRPVNVLGQSVDPLGNPTPTISLEPSLIDVGIKPGNKMNNLAKTFINNQSVPMEPRLFSSWRGVENSEYVPIGPVDISKLYSMPEIALGAAGVNVKNYENLFTAYAAESKSLRDRANSSTLKLFIRSTGKYVPVVGKDGVLYNYQIVNVYASPDDTIKTSQSTKTTNGDTTSTSISSNSSSGSQPKLIYKNLLYDMELTSNPNQLLFNTAYAINNAYTGYRGNKALGVNKNQVYEDIRIPDIYDDEDDENLISDIYE